MSIEQNGVNPVVLLSKEGGAGTEFNDNNDPQQKDDQPKKYVPPHMRGRVADDEARKATRPRSPGRDDSRTRGWGRDSPRDTDRQRRFSPPRENERTRGWGRDDGNLDNSQSLGGSRSSVFTGGAPGGSRDVLLRRNERLEEELFSKGHGGAEPGAPPLDFDAYEVPVEVTGRDVPKPLETFAKCDFGVVLSNSINLCGYVKPTPVQKWSIPIAQEGRDLMACAQTGSGKTAAFLLPIISALLRQPAPVPVGPRYGRRSVARPAAVILAPVRELAGQIYDEARKFAYRSSLGISVLYGGAPMGDQLRQLERGVDIVVATPGRLFDVIERTKITMEDVRFLVLDEADRMLDMGFEPQIRRIVEDSNMPTAEGGRQTLLFSATFPREIQQLAADFLHDYLFLVVGTIGKPTALVEQRVELVNERDKFSLLADLIHSVDGLTLVFVETKRAADSLEDDLYRAGFESASIHGDRTQQEREAALRSFREQRTRVLVATDVASRGLDIPEVAHVINFDIPKTVDDYVHRIGRTGRAGHKGIATALFTDRDGGHARDILQVMKEGDAEIPKWLEDMARRSAFGGRSGGGGGARGRATDFRRGSAAGGDRFGNSWGGGGGSGSWGGASKGASWGGGGKEWPVSDRPAPRREEKEKEQKSSPADWWDN